MVAKLEEKKKDTVGAFVRSIVYGETKMFHYWFKLFISQCPKLNFGNPKNTFDLSI